MRKVIVSNQVIKKIVDLESFLINGLKLSEEASLKRSSRMRLFVHSLANLVDYPTCRFKKWLKLNLRCAVFEIDWVFAYERFDDGIIIIDM